MDTSCFWIYTPSSLSRFAYPLQPHTGPLPIGYHFRLPLQSNLRNRYIYPVHHVTDILHPPAYEDGTDKEFRKSAIKTQTQGNYPKRNILQLKNGESLKKVHTVPQHKGFISSSQQTDVSTYKKEAT